MLEAVARSLTHLVILQQCTILAVHWARNRRITDVLTDDPAAASHQGLRHCTQHAAACKFQRSFLHKNSLLHVAK